MKTSTKKRGQKLIKRFSRLSIKASEESKEHIKKNFFGRFSHIESIRLLILEWSLLVAALIMIAITQSFWLANSYSSHIFAAGGAYTEATLGKVNSMNPLFATTSSEKTLSRLMFATLTTVDYSGHPGAGLAATVLSDSTGKVWTIKLRDNLRWSDGEPITNADILYTVNLIQNPATSTVYDSNLTGVKVAELESGEIAFTLPTPYADFISALNIPLVPEHILKDVDPKTILEAEFSAKPIVSGAFVLNAIQSSSASTEKTIYLTANPYYYKGKPLLNSFAIRAYTNKDTLISAVNSSVVTATAELSAAEANQINSAIFNEKGSSINSGVFAFFNTASDLFKNRSTRLAVRQGINLDFVRSVATSSTPLDYPLLERQIQLSQYPTLPTYDKEAALAKIASLSINAPISLVTVRSSYLPTVAEAFKTELEALGLQVNLTIYEENQDFITNVISRRNYDILIYEIELGYDPDLLPYYHSSQATSSGLNLSNYKNTLVDDLLLAARGTLDTTLRAKKYETFLEYWVADAPAIGLYQPNLTYFYNKNVRTFSNDVRLITPLDRFSDITSWAAVKETKNRTP